MGHISRLFGIARQKKMATQCGHAAGVTATFIPTIKNVRFFLTQRAMAPLYVGTIPQSIYLHRTNVLKGFVWRVRFSDRTFLGFQS